MTFTFCIPDNEQDKILFDYDEGAPERIDTQVEAGKMFVFANREGMITLAKVLLKMVDGSYSGGFHVHLRKDFNADNAEVLTIGLLKDD